MWNVIQLNLNYQLKYTYIFKFNFKSCSESGKCNEVRNHTIWKVGDYGSISGKHKNKKIMNSLKLMNNR